MKSEVGVRNEHNWYILTTDLIIHYSITNISNQTPEFLCILGIVKETFNITLLGQQLKSLKNIFQFSTNHCLSAVNINLGAYDLTAQVPSSSLLPWHCLQEQVDRVR